MESKPGYNPFSLEHGIYSYLPKPDPSLYVKYKSLTVETLKARNTNQESDNIWKSHNTLTSNTGINLMNFVTPSKK